MARRHGEETETGKFDANEALVFGSKMMEKVDDEEEEMEKVENNGEEEEQKKVMEGEGEEGEEEDRKGDRSYRTGSHRDGDRDANADIKADTNAADSDSTGKAISTCTTQSSRIQGPSDNGADNGASEAIGIDGKDAENANNDIEHGDNNDDAEINDETDDNYYERDDDEDDDDDKDDDEDDGVSGSGFNELAGLEGGKSTIKRVGREQPQDRLCQREKWHSNSAKAANADAFDTGNKSFTAGNGFPGARADVDDAGESKGAAKEKKEAVTGTASTGATSDLEDTPLLRDDDEGPGISMNRRKTMEEENLFEEKMTTTKKKKTTLTKKMTTPTAMRKPDDNVISASADVFRSVNTLIATTSTSGTSWESAASANAIPASACTASACIASAWTTSTNMSNVASASASTIDTTPPCTASTSDTSPPCTTSKVKSIPTTGAVAEAMALKETNEQMLFLLLRLSNICFQLRCYWKSL